MLARGYTLNMFVPDLVAGITVGLVALPLAMAFAIASGLTPQAGIYCAIITGFLVSPSGLPAFRIPDFRPELMLSLLSAAVTVAMLGAIESLLSAVVADRMGGDRHNPNTELFAQGVANIASPLFGGLPATGALARTATNIRAGARTPMAGVVHALTLLGVLMFGARYAAFVPLPVLAAILFLVAWNMGEWREIAEIFKHTYADILVWLVTFALTVLADLTVAVEAGMVMAALLFIRRVSRTTTVSRVTPEYIESGRPHILQDKIIPDYVAIFRIHGPFLFGSTDKLRDISLQADTLPPVVLLRLRNMTAVDGTGLGAIEELAEDLREKGKTLVICGAPSQPAGAMRKAEFHERLGDANICVSVQDALDRAAQIVRNSPTASPMRNEPLNSESIGITPPSR